MNSRLSDTEKCISDLEDRIIEFTNQNSRKKNKFFLNECILRDLWDKSINTHIIGAPEGEEREKGTEMYLRKLWLKPSLKKETDIQVQEA